MEIARIDALLSRNKAPLQAERTPQKPKTVKERPREFPLRIRMPPSSSVAPPQSKTSLLPIGRRQGASREHTSRPSKRNVVMADLRDVGYRIVPLSMLEEACANDSPTE